MNTYKKYCPNVFVAKCEERHAKGDTITLTTKYGKEHECIVFNFLFEKDGFSYYSIIRADGFNVQEYAKRKAEKLNGYGANAMKKSNEYREAAKEKRGFLALAEPIKIGHHSEKRHRALIARNWAREEKRFAYSDKASEYATRAEYWESRTNVINLSMPESLGYYEYKLEEAKAKHEGLKSGEIERVHLYSLTYAKKAVNEMTKKLETARKLWA